MKMRLAEKYALPIVCFIDTPGAYPGVGSEQRGQAEAIAMNLREMSRMRTPIVAVVIGEGGSGGALGIGVGDRVAMLEHSWYSVISPEGCAAILWKEANEKTNNLAASALSLTARQNLENWFDRRCPPGTLGRRAPRSRGHRQGNRDLGPGPTSRAGKAEARDPCSPSIREVPRDRCGHHAGGGPGRSRSEPHSAGTSGSRRSGLTVWGVVRYACPVILGTSGPSSSEDPFLA